MAARDGTGCWLPKLTRGQGASVWQTSIATLTSCVTPSLITVACEDHINPAAYPQMTTTIVQPSVPGINIAKMRPSMKILKMNIAIQHISNVQMNLLNSLKASLILSSNYLRPLRLYINTQDIHDSTVLCKLLC